MKKIGLLLCFLSISLWSSAQCPDDNHPHMIDLGLPSGTLWSCCNVGASSPEQYGGYYAWGEVETKGSYYWDTYYQDYMNLGYDIAGTQYDAATANWGTSWCMPNDNQCDELIKNCSSEMMTYNGVYGRKFIGLNGGTIFLPAAGQKYGTTSNAGSYGKYRLSTLREFLIYRIDVYGVRHDTISYQPVLLYFNKDKLCSGWDDSCDGIPVRPVSTSQTIVSCIASKSFREEYHGKEVKGFTADGTSEIVIRLSNKSMVFDENVSTHFFLNGLEIGENMAGQVKDVKYFNDSIAITLTAPRNFLLDGASEYNVEMKITPYSEGHSLATVSTSYKVLRPGLLIMHGFRGHPVSFDNMRVQLLNTGMYGRNQMLAYNYSASNTATFYVNTHEKEVVKKGCEALCKQLFEKEGIVSTRYDMVGHSMGGILERLYVQEVTNGKESTNSIITINTPHYGSRLGKTFNWVPKLLTNVKISMENAADEVEKQKWARFFVDIDGLSAKLNNTSADINTLDVGIDLAPGSPAINNLNGANASRLVGVPVHSVCTYVDNASLQTILQSKIKEIKPLGVLERGRVLWDGLIIKNKQNLAQMYYNEVSDMVVPLSSQKGGLTGSNTSVFCGTIDQANHSACLQWNKVHQEVARLLQASRNSSNFSMAGFLSNNAAGARAESVEDEYIERFELPRDGSFISATFEPITSVDYTHLCKISHSDDMQTIEVFAMPTDSTLVFGLDEDEMKFNLTGSPTEKLMFYIVGRTDYDALLFDSVEVNIDPSQADIQRIYRTSEREVIDISYGTNSATIHIPSLRAGTVWSLHTVGGTLLEKGESTSDAVILRKRKSGLYILNVVQGNKTKSYKLDLTFR